MAEAAVNQLSPEQIEEQKKAQELERKRKMHEALRARMSLSKLEAKFTGGGSPFTPYWARKEDEAEMARLDLLGFRIVRESLDSKSPKRWKAQGLRAEGTYIMGDVILMEIPTEEWDFYLTENNIRSKGMAQAAQDKFIEDAEKQGAPTFKVKRAS